MITFTYDPINGIAVPDGVVETEYKNIMRLKDTGLPLTTMYSTSNIFDYVRLQICLDKLDYNEVRFSYNGQTLRIDRNGRIANWPMGFCDYNDKINEQLLMGLVENFK